jgi:hypothetical protein
MFSEILNKGRRADIVRRELAGGIARSLCLANRFGQIFLDGYG